MDKTVRRCCCSDDGVGGSLRIVLRRMTHRISREWRLSTLGKLEWQHACLLGQVKSMECKQAGYAIPSSIQSRNNLSLPQNSPATCSNAAIGKAAEQGSELTPPRARAPISMFQHDARENLNGPEFSFRLDYNAEHTQKTSYIAY